MAERTGKSGVSAALRSSHSRADRSRAYSLDLCGTWFRLRCPDCGASGHGTRLWARRYRCGDTLCPDCARATGARRAATLRATIRRLRHRLPRRVRLRLLTLTVRHPPDAWRLDTLRDAVARAWRGWRRVWRILGRDAYSAAAVALEVGPSGGVHLHALVLSPCVPYDTVRDAWRSGTGDSYVIHDALLQLDGRLDGVAEVCKYLCKLSLPPERQVMAYAASSGGRRWRTYGLFFGLSTVPVDRDPWICPLCGFRGIPELDGVLSPEDCANAGLPAGPKNTS